MYKSYGTVTFQTSNKTDYGFFHIYSILKDGTHDNVRNAFKGRRRALQHEGVCIYIYVRFQWKMSG